MGAVPGHSILGTRSQCHQADLGWPAIRAAGVRSLHEQVPPRLRHFAIEVFIFAEAFGIPLLRQDAIDRLVGIHDLAPEHDEQGSFVSTAAIRSAYKKTKAGSALRFSLYLNGDYGDEGSQEDETVLAELPQEFVKDVHKNLSRGGHEEGLHFNLYTYDYYKHSS
jgi:hypothetical protein